MNHADTTMKYFVRDDGSCNHIVIFDACTGEFLSNPGGQGYESGSSWSRGQAWALYGFTLSFLHTGEKKYLETAQRVAGYFISQVRDDWIPKCDFRQPEGESLKDACAGADDALEQSVVDILSVLDYVQTTILDTDEYLQGKAA